MIDPRGAFRVLCVQCGALPGWPCRTKLGNDARYPHEHRETFLEGEIAVGNLKRHATALVRSHGWIEPRDKP